MRVAPTWFRAAPLKRGLTSTVGAVVAVISLSSSTGCTRSLASAPRPDLSGTWDVVYDDYMDVEIRVGERVQHARIRRAGGHVLASDAQGKIALEIDCSREELICPHEVWSAELTLTNRTGDLDDEGEHLSVSLASEGSGPCVLGDSSALGANVVSIGSPRDRNWQATALSGGRATTVISGRCLGGRGSAGGVQVALSSGFSAVLR